MNKNSNKYKHTWIWGKLNLSIYKAVTSFYSKEADGKVLKNNEAKEITKMIKQNGMAGTTKNK